LYRELIAATRATVSTLEHVAQRLAAGATIQAELWLGQVRHYLPLIERIITQAERRVLAGETVPSGEKLVRRFGAKPRKNFVDDQAASPSSWKTPRMAVWMAA
jgi:IS5 family transposase